MLTDIADLMLGRTCLVCQEIGSELCERCLQSVRGQVVVRDGRPPIAVAGPYAGLLGEAIIAYKERGHRALARPLGALLVDALAALEPSAGQRRLVIVPIPGHRRPARGFDALGGILSAARRHATHRDLTVDVWPALRRTREHGPVKDLGRQERYLQVHGTMRVKPPVASRTPCVVLVDDVITTGSTSAEATRALSEAGIRVIGVCAVAAVQSWWTTGPSSRVGR